MQGATDEAVVRGLAARWCADAGLAPGRFRGSGHEALRRELRRALIDLRNHHKCDVLVVLTDSDSDDAGHWRNVKQREWNVVPADCQHLTVFGVAQRNIECWLALDRVALASEIGCHPDEIKVEDPKGVVESGFGYRKAGVDIDDVKARITEFVRAGPIRNWIRNGDSFAEFYDDVRALAARLGCDVPNERESAEIP